MMTAKKIRKILGLATVVSGLFFYTWFFQISKISKLPLGSYHAWRQADCISVTNNLYEGNSTLFNPRTHYAKNDGTGLAAGELPIVNLLVANVYKVFGKSEVNYRCIIWGFYFIGIIFLFLLFFEFSEHSFLSALFSLLIGSSSILLYYAINFLPDVPALSLGIVGLFWITRATRKQQLPLYIIGIVAILLASIIKLTLAILLISIAVVLLMELIMHGKKWFNVWALLWIAGSFVFIFAWYHHAYRLDHQHPPFIFLTETRSYFNTYFLERPLIWYKVKQTWLPQVFLPVVWLFVMFGGLLSMLFSKRVKIEHSLLACITFVLAIIFFLLMYRQFYLHDYLWIGLLIVPIVFSIPLIQVLASWPDKMARWSFIIFMSMLLVLQSFNTRIILKERYFLFDNALVYNPHLIGLKNELRRQGIKKNDLVISIPDPSPNISLVLMDQYGFTNYRDTNRDSLGILQSISMGAKYLIVSQDSELKKKDLLSFFKFQLFDYKGIRVFDLKPMK